MTSREVYEKLEGFYEKTRQNPKVWIGLGILLAVILLIWLPPWRVSHFEINNATVEADLENQYRATLAQILGGSTVAVGIYFAWGNLVTAREGQITERFTRAVDQLGAVDKDGNPTLEIRLGGIYALERIANESDKDYWPIMEILTAYIRKNSNVEAVNNKKVTYLSMDAQDDKNLRIGDQQVRTMPFDIQAALTVIGRRKSRFNGGESSSLNLRLTCLQNSNLRGTHFEGTDFTNANLEKTNLRDANLEGANFMNASLEGADLRDAKFKGAILFQANIKGAHLGVANLGEADLKEANLEGANLIGSNFEGADLSYVNFKGADLSYVNFKGANLYHANFERADLGNANLTSANLTSAYGLSLEQLAKVKTLCDTKLDEELKIKLKGKWSALFK